MPTVNLDRAEFFARLGKEYGQSQRIPVCEFAPEAVPILQRSKNSMNFCSSSDWSSTRT